MNQPWVYMCPLSRSPLPNPCPSHPSGLSQCTSFVCPVSCIEFELVIYFTNGNTHISVLFSQIISPLPSASLPWKCVLVASFSRPSGLGLGLEQHHWLSLTSRLQRDHSGSKIEDQALSLCSGSTDSKTLEYQRNNSQFSSLQSLSLVWLLPHESQHSRPPCPSPTPGVHSDSHPSSQWCHPPFSSSVVTFSSCPQSLPASESFQMSQLFAWGSQSTRVSALASVLPKKFQGWSTSEWTCWISLQSKDSQESSPTPQFKSINSLALSLLHI